MITTHTQIFALLALFGFALVPADRAFGQPKPTGGSSSDSAPKTVVIYKSRGEFGETSYSSVPARGAESVEVLIAPAVSKTKTRKDEIATATPKRRSYEVAFLTPRNGSVIRSNGGDVTVALDVKPQLLASHRLVVELDGEKTSFNSSEFVLSSLSRGVHQLRVTILDAGGNVVNTPELSSFRISRVSRLNPHPAVAAPRAPRAETAPQPPRAPAAGGAANTFQRTP